MLATGGGGAGGHLKKIFRTYQNFFQTYHIFSRKWQKFSRGTKKFSGDIIFFPENHKNFPDISKFHPKITEFLNTKTIQKQYKNKPNHKSKAIGQKMQSKRVNDIR